MKFLLLVSMILTLSVVFASGQKVSFKQASCTNRNVEEVSSRGIKIGAKIEEVLNLFASNEEDKQKIRNNSSGRKRTNVGYEFFSATPPPDAERFAGIDSYVFDFLDGRLVGFNVGYTKPRWKNANHFAEKITEIFDLPAVEHWSGSDYQTAIQCENYRIQIQVSNDSDNARSYFSIYDNRIGEILKQREQKFEDEQREKDLKLFKP